MKMKFVCFLCLGLAFAASAKVQDNWTVPKATSGAINIDGGRQLFVDSWAIESTRWLKRHWFAPTKIDGPIIRPTRDDGTRDGGCVAAQAGGLWWDPTIGKFRFWYEDDWTGNRRYAESKDGLAWEFPDLGKIKGTNRVFTNVEERKDRGDIDCWSVSPDYQAENPYARWTMLASAQGTFTPDTLYDSLDGRTFRKLGISGYSGDCTYMYYDTILNGWVLSLRDYWHWRSRSFFLMKDFSIPNPQYACDAAHLDGKRVRPEKWTALPNGELYSFLAVPYESLMLGVCQMHRGMELFSEDGRTLLDGNSSFHIGMPKYTDLQFRFSRDGKEYYIADEACAIRPSGLGSGKWDTNYLNPVGGVCVIKDEKLWFYYTGVRGDGEMRRDVVGDDTKAYERGMYYNAAIGAATLRRDGFCGMVADRRGELITKPLDFTGSHLFVNAECLFGELTAEVIDKNGQPFPGFSFADCAGLKYVDRTKAELKFKGGSLAALEGKKPRIRFFLHCATFFSFWISPSERGESRGYVAAGGPAYPGLRDIVK